MATARYEQDPRRDALTQIGRRYPHLVPQVSTGRDNVIRRGPGAEIVSVKLDQIVRFGNGRSNEKRMECPTTVLTHSIRVEALALGLVRVCERLPKPPHLDPVKVVDMARGHDIEEARMGDITKDIKDRMSPHERVRHAESVRREMLDIGRKEYGLKIGSPEWIMFVAYVEETMAKRTLEAQIVKIADLLDAVGEIMHELRCGNQQFAPLLEEYKGTLSQAQTKYPLWNALKGDASIQLAVPPQPEEFLALPHLMPLDFGNLGEGRARSRKFRQKLMQGNIPPFYKTWLQITLLRFGEHSPQVLFPKWDIAPLVI